ncbi:hypothetical protein MKX01_038338 [Papaver californicum]|nr:hypothetical protein MKX01_038338 [Papaver californicum]
MAVLRYPIVVIPQKNETKNIIQNNSNDCNELKAALGALIESSKAYCTDACLKRHLEARDWDIVKAKKMVEETIHWRLTFKPSDIHWPKFTFHDRHGRTVLTMRPGKQIVKYILDPKTFKKVKFVYPQDKDSLELMKTYFDDKNLPTEFGGRANLQYDHEEFSKLMVEDELKATREKLEKMEHTNSDCLKPEVAQESVVAPASI